MGQDGVELPAGKRGQKGRGAALASLVPGEDRASRAEPRGEELREADQRFVRPSARGRQQ